MSNNASIEIYRVHRNVGIGPVTLDFVYFKILDGIDPEIINNRFESTEGDIGQINYEAGSEFGNWVTLDYKSVFNPGDRFLKDGTFEKAANPDFSKERDFRGLTESGDDPMCPDY